MTDSGTERAWIVRLLRVRAAIHRKNHANLLASYDIQRAIVSRSTADALELAADAIERGEHVVSDS